jgi:hypothetical protein
MKKSIWMKTVLVDANNWQTSDYNLIYSIDKHASWDTAFYISDDSDRELKLR